jgi:hypothetical protein
MSILAIVGLTVLVIVATILGIMAGASVRSRNSNGFTVICPLVLFVGFLVAAIACDGSLRFVFAALTAGLFGMFFKWAVD